MIRLHAPAKVNFFLHVTGRRADGYHELQTFFRLIDYSDCLTLEPREDNRFEYADDSSLEFGESNLCLRAAKLAHSKYPTGCGASIFLNKRIPVGAGLGGGSSDAAAVLHGLNRLWGQPLDLETLAELGLELGADVPFFVYGRNAWAGRHWRKVDLFGLPAGGCAGVTDACTGEYGAGIQESGIDTMGCAYHNEPYGCILGE